MRHGGVAVGARLDADADAEERDPTDIVQAAVVRRTRVPRQAQGKWWELVSRVCGRQRRNEPIIGVPRVDACPALLGGRVRGALAGSPDSERGGRGRARPGPRRDGRGDPRHRARGVQRVSSSLSLPRRARVRVAGVRGFRRRRLATVRDSHTSGRRVGHRGPRRGRGGPREEPVRPRQAATRPLILRVPERTHVRGVRAVRRVFVPPARSPPRVEDVVARTRDRRREKNRPNDSAPRCRRGR